MNTDELIISLIPAEILDAVPDDKKDHVKGNVAKYIRREKADLYARLSEGAEISDALKEETASEISAFIAMVKSKHGIS